jgi:uncharacterized protein YecE (DUF72 family)
MGLMIGTSGWQYRDWRGVLYPAGVPQARWLECYAETFPVVENNGTFYRLPSPQAFADWRNRTPDGFTMVVKASRYLTHIRRLRDPAEPVARLLAAAVQLGPRLGPVLVQLPPNMTADPDALDGVLTEFARFKPPRDAPRVRRPIQVAVEFRHESWWTEEVKAILVRHDAALSWADREEKPLAPLWRTAGWGYLRMHEGAARSWPRYTSRALRRWLEIIGENWPPGQDVYVFFNNDQHGAAPTDALALAKLARAANMKVRGLSGNAPG